MLNIQSAQAVIEIYHQAQNEDPAGTAAAALASPHISNFQGYKNQLSTEVIQN